MKTALKISGLLVGFFLFLCVTIKNKPIFTYIYDVISPATKYVQNAAGDFFSRSVSSTQDYSKKLFDNSVPRLKDSVESKQAANLKAPEESITPHEKAQLDELIKNH